MAQIRVIRSLAAGAGWVLIAMRGRLAAGATVLPVPHR